MAALFPTHLVIAVVVVLAFAFGCAPAQSKDSPRTRTRTKTQRRAAQKQPEVYQQRLVDWLLEDPDAFFHPGVLFKRLGPDGTTGPYAFHATEDIPKGTPLIVLPRRYVIESFLPALLVDDGSGDIDFENDPRMCFTVHKIIEEYQKVLQAKTKTKTKNDDSSGNSNSNSNNGNHENGSFYEPYLSYLFDETVGGTSRGLLPTSWSEPAQEILNRMLNYSEEHKGNILEPEHYGYFYITEWCEYQEGPHNLNALVFEEDDNDNDNDNDKAEKEKEEEQTKEEQTEEEQTKETVTDNNDENETVLTLDEQLKVLHAQDAFLFLRSRGWYDKLLPVVDMLNHINGPARNVEVTPIDDSSPPKDVAAYTSRDVKAGEQLQYSYSECFDETCEFAELKYNFHTQTIFKEYGFVELYPQRWYLGGSFEENPDKDDVQALTVEVDRDGATNELILRWIFNTPNSATLEWVRTQLDRLLSIESEIRERVASLPEAVAKEYGDFTYLFNVEHEHDTLLEYFEAYVAMLRLALKHKDDPLYISGQEFKEELEELKRSGRQLTMEDIRNHELLKEAPPLANDEL